MSDLYILEKDSNSLSFSKLRLSALLNKSVGNLKRPAKVPFLHLTLFKLQMGTGCVAGFVAGARLL